MSLNAIQKSPGGVTFLLSSRLARTLQSGIHSGALDSLTASGNDGVIVAGMTFESAPMSLARLTFSATISAMDAFTTSQLLSGHDWTRIKYDEFLRKDSLSLGMYLLPRGSTDPQTPHKEDEVYYIVSGKGTIRVAGDDQPVGPGSIVFVAKGAEHRFHAITEDMAILVFFAPPEPSGTPPAKSKG